MTNKDKFLREGVSVEEFIEAFCMSGRSAVNGIQAYLLKDFFKEQVKPIKPTLSEDEKAILRNIKGHPKYISRQKGHGLIAYDSAKREGKTGWSYDNGRAMYSFSHLFQFIKEGEEYEIKELLGDEE